MAHVLVRSSTMTVLDSSLKVINLIFRLAFLHHCLQGNYFGHFLTRHMPIGFADITRFQDSGKDADSIEAPCDIVRGS